MNLEKKLTELISILSQALEIHLNHGQLFMLNSSEIFFSMETMSIDGLKNKEIQSTNNFGSIRFPLTFHRLDSSSVSIRVRVSIERF